MNQIPREWILIVVGFALISAAFFGLNRVTSIGSGSSAPPALQATNAFNNQTSQNASGPESVGVAASEGGQAASSQPESHIVQAGETLQGIANQYSVSMDTLVDINEITDPNVLSAGQRLYLPTSSAESADTVTEQQPTEIELIQILPDSELVYGPSAKDFSIDQFVPQDSYLRSYRGSVEQTSLDGISIVQLVADRSRVNPKLLLAALEHRSGWVTQSTPSVTDEAMMGNLTGMPGLYSQLEWAANRFNLGFYGRSEGGLTGVVLADGGQVPFSANLTNGTAGVHNWLAATSNYNQWLREASRDGFYATYEQLFGNPFAVADDSYWPPAEIPDMDLPWESGETWYFTGGPHGGWISGSGWAALDFVPPDQKLGCYDTDSWVTAVANGVVTRSNFGAVVLDLDGDGYAGTGWAILYQHIATRDRAEVGAKLRAGDYVGHPSCEGGYSSGTHLHIARTYNGRWVSADGAYPFNLSGWISSGSGSEYNGTLSRNGVIQPATVGRIPENAITE